MIYLNIRISKIIFINGNSHCDKEGIILNKRLIIFVILVLSLLFPTISTTFEKLMIPDKVLLIGHQIDDTTIDFSKEIRDKEKIKEFESLFNEVEFLEGEWNNETPYPDMITQIRHKEGISTHWFEIWINDEECIVLISMSDETLVGRLTKSQVDTLKRIVNE